MRQKGKTIKMCGVLLLALAFCVPGTAQPAEANDALPEAAEGVEPAEDAAETAAFMGSEEAQAEETQDEETIASGTCGENVTWVLENDGVLTISGTGETESYYTSSAIPWYTYRYYITAVQVEEGVTSIGDSAFYNCYRLVNASIAGSVVTIGSGAFAGTSLTSVTGMTGVTTFGAYAFQGTSFTEFAFPENTTTIGDYVFCGCEALKEIVLPASVQTIGENIAYNAPAVEKLTAAENNKSFCTVDGILYDLGQTTLLAYPTAKEGSSFTVPDTVTTLAPYCFSYQANLVTVAIPETVTTIGDGAFYGMSALETITIPESVTEVGMFTFEGSAIQTLHFNASVSETPYRMCYDCEGLETVTFENEMLTTIYNWAFPYCANLSSVTLPSNLERIEASTFYGCTSLAELTFPASVTYIDGSAFKNSGITEFPSWLTLTDGGDYVLLASLTLTGTEMYDMAQEVLYLVNKEREAEGLTALAMDEDLLEAAMQRAAELAVNFSHTRPDGSSCFTASAKMTAENIAVAQTSASGVMESWMNSSGHKANILSESSTSIGVGCFYHNGVYYWVQCFGTNEATSFTVPFNQTTTRTVNAEVSMLDASYFGIVDGTDYDAPADTKTMIVCYVNQGWSYVCCTPDASDFDWTSSDTAVATVNSEGIVTLHGKGEYTITAKLKKTPYTEVTYSATSTYGFIYGDVNESGDVDAADALAVLRAVVRLAELSEAQESAADVDGDGEVQAPDALLILKKVVRLIDTFPVESVEK